MAKTYNEMAQWEQAQVGTVGLPQVWTPANWTTADDNDCATFQSYAWFGDYRYYVVSQFANNFPHVNGQVGAFACFRWPGSSDDYDHIGLVISPVDGDGNFTTIEANTSGPQSGHQVANKTRNVENVVCFVLPPYESGEDELSAAEVAEIKAFITQEADRVSGYLRREARARLYKNQTSSLYMIAKIETGYCRVLEGDQTAQLSEILSLQQNGYLEIATNEIPQPVTQDVWDNVIAKCAKARQDFSLTLTTTAHN